MCEGRVGAHSGPMTNDYTLMKTMVAERQARYLDEARQNRLARLAHLGRRARWAHPAPGLAHPAPQSAAPARPEGQASCGGAVAA